MHHGRGENIRMHAYNAVEVDEWTWWIYSTRKDFLFIFYNVILTRHYTVGYKNGYKSNMKITPLYHQAEKHSNAN